MSYYRIQTEESPDWKGAAVDTSIFDEDVDQLRKEAAPQTSTLSEKEASTLWGSLFRRRDEQRDEVKRAQSVVSFDETPWEYNRQGKMKWYMHPHKEAGSHLMMIYLQEIPPGSRSGKVLQQGGRAFFIWQGKGYSIVNGKRYDWEKEDLLLLPIRVQGNTFQHFNTDPANPALILAVAPNVTEILGVDQGLGLEQLENCPGYPW
jgi:gentisate 1,2-dioxygenase